jgi:hypothetical protein
VSEFTPDQQLLIAAKITYAAVATKRVEGMDQNERGWRDLLYSAIRRCDPSWNPK